MKLSFRRISLLATALIALAVPSTAAANDMFAGITVTPSPLTAGAHANVSVELRFVPKSPHTSQIKLHLPAGLTGDPTAAALCPRATFDAQQDACPETSKIGSLQVHAAVHIPIWGMTTKDISGDVYNLETDGSTPAAFGMIIRPGSFASNQFLVVPVAIRTADGGLDSTINLPPAKSGLIEVWNEQMTVTFNGIGPSGKPFMSNPTSCGPANYSAEATEEGTNRVEKVSGSFTPTGCAGLPFTPTFTLQAESSQHSALSGYNFGFQYPDDAAVKTQAHLKRAEVTLPASVNSKATSFPRCSDANFDNNGGPANCARETQLGTVTFITPAVGQLDGAIYLGPSTNANQYPLLVNVAGKGILLKQKGLATVNANGTVTAVFDNLLQVPFSYMGLTFYGGDQALLANSSKCGAQSATAKLTPWSGTADKAVTASFALDADGKGGAC